MVDQSRYNQVESTASSALTNGIDFKAILVSANYQVISRFPGRIEVIVAQIPKVKR
jgi:hypothetical protein